MSSIGSVGTALRSSETPERSALLQWMIFTGLCIFAAVLLVHYGLIRLMLSADRTYISSFISVSETKAPNAFEPRRRSASERSSRLWSMCPLPCALALMTRLLM